MIGCSKSSPLGADAGGDRAGTGGATAGMGGATAGMGGATADANVGGEDGGADCVPFVPFGPAAACSPQRSQPGCLATYETEVASLVGLPCIYPPCYQAGECGQYKVVRYNIGFEGGGYTCIYDAGGALTSFGGSCSVDKPVLPCTIYSDVPEIPTDAGLLKLCPHP
jgi:hypothetical protein